MIGRYGGHKWHGFWLKVLDARVELILSTEFRLARLFEANTRYQLEREDLHENKLQAL